MDFLQFDAGSSRAKAPFSITDLVHAALLRALSDSSPAVGADAGSGSVDCGAVAELMVQDITFLKEIRFITMLAFDQAPNNLREAIVQLGSQRTNNVTFACILLDRLRRQNSMQWCLHRALFLADVCWAVSRVQNVEESEQVFIMQLLQSLGYLTPHWEKQVVGGEKLRQLMLVAELAAGYMPPAGAPSSPLTSMQASHEWLADTGLDEFLDSLTSVQ